MLQFPVRPSDDARLLLIMRAGHADVVKATRSVAGRNFKVTTGWNHYVYTTGRDFSSTPRRGYPAQKTVRPNLLLHSGTVRNFYRLASAGRRVGAADGPCHQVRC